MKLTLPSLSVIWESALKTFQRFPLVIGSSIIGAIAVVWLINQNGASDDVEARFIALSFVSFLGISWYYSITVFLEQLKAKEIVSWPFLAAAAIAIIGYYLYLDNILMDAKAEVWYQLFLFFLGTHLFAAFAPFTSSNHIDQFWEYNKTLFLRFLISGVYSAALFIGLSVAMLALDNLLEINIEGEFYPSLFVVIAGVFNTLFFLSGLPSNEQIPVKEIEYPSGLKVFVQYVLISLVTVYIVILYAYLVKILLQWELPNGWVANLVLSFSIAGILSLLLLYPIQEEDGKKWIQLFSKWYYRALIPLLVLLFFSIWVRISEYGVTINRFFVATLGVWLTLIVGYFIFSKVKSIKLVPISLTAFVIVSAVGPFSAMNVSERSQINRLLEITEAHNIELPTSSNSSVSMLSDSTIAEVQSIVNYVIDNHGVKAFSTIFSVEEINVISDSSNAKKILLEEFLGVPYGVGTMVEGKIIGQNFAYSFYENPILEITGYRYYLGSFNFYATDINHTFTIDEVPYSITFNNERLEFILNSNIGEVHISIKDTIKILHSANNGNWYSKNWETNQLIIEDSSSELGLLMLITQLNGQTGASDSVSNITIQLFAK